MSQHGGTRKPQRSSPVYLDKAYYLAIQHGSILIIFFNTPAWRPDQAQGLRPVAGGAGEGQQHVGSGGPRTPRLQGDHPCLAAARQQRGI